VSTVVLLTCLLTIAAAFQSVRTAPDVERDAEAEGKPLEGAVLSELWRLHSRV